MMIGQRNLQNPAVHVPPWLSNDQMDNLRGGFSPDGGDDFSAFLQNDAAVLKALQRFLPSNSSDGIVDFNSDSEKDVEFPLDAFAYDTFRMYDFKVSKCSRARPHDWTECPFAHPGEKARRRDPRRYRYTGTPCPEFRKGNCRKGDLCEFAHGVFECWLHPSRYRTQPCKDGVLCQRRVCFFAHSPEQLRILSPRGDAYDGSPRKYGFDGSGGRHPHFVPLSDSGSPPPESPPLSPVNAASSGHSLSRSPINDVMASLRQMQLNKVKSMPSSWGVQMGSSPVLGSPRLHISGSGFGSLPNTPTRRSGVCHFELWDEGSGLEEYPMERVESGRDLRAKMFEKLSKENPLDGSEAVPNPKPNDRGPDVGWVSDLIQ
ncbi:unnamed protein product [Cuscuta epithymum]|uniref:C3H1-type domain-containing protein n=1 Tax=Cuscuta epithymum TaxID=186058 RepID=A0AAV0BYR0_9ASTE|nr:unnamed protein product [Cuscuta epithymum]